MYTDDLFAAEYYPTQFTPSVLSHPAMKPAKRFTLRCPAPKTGKIPAGVHLSKWQDTPNRYNVHRAMRDVTDGLDARGVTWQLWHANVTTRIPFRSPDYWSVSDHLETHPYQIEAVYIPSEARLAVLWYDWQGVDWLDTRGDIERDLAVYALTFSQTLTE